MIKKVGILSGVFAVALIVYMLANRQWMARGDARYAVFEDARLPLVYVEMFGKKVNPMHGYRQDMGNAVARDCLTILPSDRALSVHVVGGSEAVQGVRYEIRSLDQDRLVENTVLESWDRGEEGLHAVLPIQNLLAEDREYLLRLDLDMQSMGTVHYYTRIVWTQDTNVRAMIDLATDFSARTFSYVDAQELVTYMEPTNSEDNSSFGYTSIHSSFAHLTWGDLGMEPVGEVQVTLKERAGVMGCISLSYLASREGANGRETYQVEESFTMKWNEVRIYLMDYERTVDQVYTGNRAEFSGKRILLGITNDGRVSRKASPDGNVIGYRVNGDLWGYNQKERQGTQIFSFRSGNMQDQRGGFGQHDIRILQVGDNGDMDFLVYGYQNRGNHEGESGIVGYHFQKEGNVLWERFYIPVKLSFERLREDLGQLAFRSQTDMLYLYLDHAIYGIDLKSNEIMVVADALEEGSFAVSADQARIVWQEGGKRYGSSLLHLMDLETGEKQNILGAEDEYLQTLGFVGRDLVYGHARAGDQWITNGRMEGFPMYAVEVVNDRMETEARYEKDGYYIVEAMVEESRIHLNRMVKTGQGQFEPAQPDTIVCNMDMGPGKLDGIGWFASQERGRVYFVQLEQEIRGGRNIRIEASERVSYDQAGVLELKSNYQLDGIGFYAYGGGKLLGSTTDFPQAMAMAYEKMGVVVNQDHQILWSRVNRGTVQNIGDPLTAFAPVERKLEGFSGSKGYGDGMTVLDARGCGMMQMLYFIDQGIPVLGYTGEGSYLLLCGFDQYNVTVYDPEARETYKAGLNDSTEFFRQRGNDFVCAVGP